MALPTPNLIPEIHLLLLQTKAVTAFEEAKEKYLDTLNLAKGVLRFHIHEASLSQLEESVKFDLMVSAANVRSTSHHPHPAELY